MLQVLRAGNVVYPNLLPCSNSSSRRQPCCTAVRAQAGQKYDYDLIIVGAGVGGHGAALHAVESVSFWVC